MLPSLHRRAVLAGLPIAALAPLTARAQSLEAIDRLAAAVYDAWGKTPLTARRAIFVTQRATGYGIFEERPTRVFKAGEPLLVYAEPIGYGFRRAEGGMYEFGFAIDFAIKTPTGTILGGKEDFGNVTQRSHLRNLEFMLNLSLDVTGAPPGDYVLAYKLRDVTGPKTATLELPFTIRG